MLSVDSVDPQTSEVPLHHEDFHRLGGLSQCWLQLLWLCSHGLNTHGDPTFWGHDWEVPAESTWHCKIDVGNLRWSSLINWLIFACFCFCLSLTIAFSKIYLLNMVIFLCTRLLTPGCTWDPKGTRHNGLFDASPLLAGPMNNASLTSLSWRTVAPKMASIMKQSCLFHIKCSRFYTFLRPNIEVSLHFFNCGSLASATSNWWLSIRTGFTTTRSRLQETGPHWFLGKCFLCFFPSAFKICHDVTWQ